MEIRVWLFQNYRDCRYTCNLHKFDIPALRFPRKDPVIPCKHLQCGPFRSKNRLLGIIIWHQCIESAKSKPKPKKNLAWSLQGHDMHQGKWLSRGLKEHFPAMLAPTDYGRPMTRFIYAFSISLSSKGQLISKWFFGVVDFLQKTNINKSTCGIIVVKSNLFVRFLEEIDDPKNHFS